LNGSYHTPIGGADINPWLSDPCGKAVLLSPLTR
jgi:hypothetical protein